MSIAVPFRDSVPVASATSRIVCCVPSPSDRWLQIIAHEPTPRHWYVCNDHPQFRLEQWLPHSWRSLLTSWRAIQTVKQQRANLLITADPYLSLWCTLLAALQGVKVYHIAWSFHFLTLPQGPLSWLMQWAFPKISQFTVQSRTDKQLYGEYFGIPDTRFERIHCCVPTADPLPATPLISGEYVCAVVRSRQDCQTLITALERLPTIPVVLLTEPKCLRGLFLPANISPQTRLSSNARSNILQHSRFLVAPLSDYQPCCDYELLVTAMHFSKALITTDLACTRDYAFHNSNAMLYPSHHPEALTQAIYDLWNDPIRCDFLGENGKGFAATFCSETALHRYFHQLLVRKGL